MLNQEQNEIKEHKLWLCTLINPMKYCSSSERFFEYNLNTGAQSVVGQLKQNQDGQDYYHYLVKYATPQKFDTVQKVCTQALIEPTSEQMDPEALVTRKDKSSLQGPWFFDNQKILEEREQLGKLNCYQFLNVIKVKKYEDYKQKRLQSYINDQYDGPRQSFWIYGDSLIQEKEHTSSNSHHTQRNQINYVIIMKMKLMFLFWMLIRVLSNFHIFLKNGEMIGKISAEAR